MLGAIATFGAAASLLGACRAPVPLSFALEDDGSSSLAKQGQSVDHGGALRGWGKLGRRQGLHPASGSSRTGLPASMAQPQGLLLITVDTLRADYLSAYGHAHVLTPSLDRLAAGGVLFREAISQSTTTTPSHASLLTGLYLQDHNVYSNFEALGHEPHTMAELFEARGFRTFGIVNMRHLNSAVGNLAQGFRAFAEGDRPRRASETVDHVLQQLDAVGDDRFFGWMHLADVHTPYRPPAPYDRFYYDRDERDPANTSLGRIWPLLPVHMSDHPFFQAWLEGITDVEWVYAQYQGAVTYVDDQIGRLLDALDDRGLLDRTAIVLTADHGESLGEHGMHFVHTGLYEPTVRVPLLMYFPGMVRRGGQVRDVVELVDVLPTVLEYFDVPKPRRIRGRSLWPAMRGEVLPRRVAFTEHAGRNLVALRTHRFKYVKHLRTNNVQPAYPFVQGREELYDLRRDPMERRDVSKGMPDVMRVMRRELRKRQRHQMRLKPGKATVDQETVEVLRALGYVR